MVEALQDRIQKAHVFDISWQQSTATYLSMKFEHWFPSIIVVQNLSIPCEHHRNTQGYTYQILSAKMMTPSQIYTLCIYVYKSKIMSKWYQHDTSLLVPRVLGIHRKTTGWCHTELLKPTGGSETLGQWCAPSQWGKCWNFPYYGSTWQNQSKSQGVINTFLKSATSKPHFYIFGGE